MAETLSVPKGFIFDPEKSTIRSNIFYNEDTASFYTKEEVPGLFSYYQRLSPIDSAALYKWYVRGLTLAQTQGSITNYPIADPLSAQNAQKVATEDLYKLELATNFPKLSEDFIRLIKLYQSFCLKGTTALEVGVVLFYHEEKQELRFVLPTQTVTSGFWKWSMKHGEKAYFLDGTETSLDQLEAEGWIKCGTSHSHNTMNCLWSGVDVADQVGTKTDPKMTALHFLLYGFKDFNDLTKAPDFQLKISASVNGAWHHQDDVIYQIIDLENEVKFEDVSYDDKILDIVTTPVSVTYGQGSNSNIYKVWGWQPKPASTKFNPGVRPVYSTSQNKTANLSNAGLITLMADIIETLEKRNVSAEKAFNDAMVICGYGEDALVEDVKDSNRNGYEWMFERGDLF